MQCNAMQCNAMQCNAMQCNAMQCNAMQCNAKNTTQHNTITLYSLKMQYTYTWWMTCLSLKRQRCLSLKSRTDIGMNDSRFLFVLHVMVINLLDEGIMTYSLCRICVLTLIIFMVLRSICFSYKDCLKPGTLLLVFTMRCKIFFSFWLMFPN